MSHVFLFRAVNVGGTAKLPMAELRALAVELGATDVHTYIASGNLIAAPPGEPAAFAEVLRAAVRDRFGFDREVLHRTTRQLQDALREHPFAVENPAHSYVYFLSAPPAAAAVAAADAVERGGDEWRVVGDNLHVRFDRGTSQATLKTDLLVRTLGVVATARNLRTITELSTR